MSHDPIMRRRKWKLIIGVLVVGIVVSGLVALMLLYMGGQGPRIF